MAKYGLQLELPTIYKLDAIIFDKNPEYCIQLIRYVIPKCRDSKTERSHIDDNINVKTQIFLINKPKQETCYCNVEKGKDQTLCLRLIRKKG